MCIVGFVFPISHIIFFDAETVRTMWPREMGRSIHIDRKSVKISFDSIFKNRVLFRIAHSYR